MDFDELQAWSVLWEAVFGEPPPIRAEAEMISQVLVEHLPPATPYAITCRTG